MFVCRAILKMTSPMKSFGAFSPNLQDLSWFPRLLDHKTNKKNCGRAAAAANICNSGEGMAKSRGNFPIRSDSSEVEGFRLNSGWCEIRGIFFLQKKLRLKAAIDETCPKLEIEMQRQVGEVVAQMGTQNCKA